MRVRLPATLGILLSFTMDVPTYAASASDSDHECSLKEYASLDVLWTRPQDVTSLPLVQVGIDDQPLKMVFDSAQPFSVLKEDIAKQLKLPMIRLGGYAEFGGAVLRSYIIVPHLRLGQFRLKNVVMFVLPAGAHFLDDDSVVGTFAMGSVTTFDIELDLGHNKINFYSTDRCPGAPVYWTDSYAVVPMRRGVLKEQYFVMELDGQKLQTTLSTTSSFSEIRPSVSKKIYGFDETSPDLRTLHSADGPSTRPYKEMTLTANGLSIMTAEVALGPRSDCMSIITRDDDGAVAYANCLGVHPLRLGNRVLTQLRLYVDTKQKQLYFTSWDARRDTTPQ